MIIDKVNDQIHLYYKDKALKDWFEAHQDVKEEVLDDCDEIIASCDSGKMSLYLTYDDNVEEWYVDHYSER